MSWEEIVGRNIRRLRKELDGVAFIHIDRFSLKQTFFETNSVKIKQKPGWLTGKSGFVVEMKLLRDALRHGIPALLTDLTNTIRHGDLCLLIGPDPILIEAKTSPRLNARGKKQVEALSKLSEFFRMDVAEDMRGYDELRRVAMTEAEVGYSDDLNRCIELASTTGVATISPERGLHYLVAYGADKETMTEALTSLPMISGEPVYLNEFKANAAWAPYYPFVLSIKSAQHLFDFLEGSLGIVVIFDSGEFELYLNERGIFRVDEDKSFPDPDGDYIVFENRSTGAKAGMSKQLLLRVALDLCSPAWLFRNHEAVLDRLAAATAHDRR